MNVLTLAAVYELHGQRAEAIELYKEILKKEPHNEEAKHGIRRLSGLRKKFRGVHEDMKEFFIKMESENDFLTFE
jgi:transcription elongation factor GreA-like protein